ncbi:hypothetical protein BDW66DRAFT_166596 [Aspergillus desertorum]
MPTVLLPSSAAAFAPRSSPKMVPNSRIEPWLTATLKRVNRVKQPLNNMAQHARCLTDTLSPTNAIWNLCSMMLPKAPESELRKDETPLGEAIFNHQVIHIEAYVVHVDMVSQNEVAFKLTPETIEALVEHHKEVYLVDAAANTWDWAEKDNQLKKLQEDFVQAANKFVGRTSARALEGLEEDGAGELLGGRSEDAKSAISALFIPLLPPPPPVVDVLRSTPLLSSSTEPETWWHDSMQQPVSVDSWKVLPFSPAPATTADANPSMWTGLSGMPETDDLRGSYDMGLQSSHLALQHIAALPTPSMLIQPCRTAVPSIPLNSQSVYIWCGWRGTIDPEVPEPDSVCLNS